MISQDRQVAAAELKEGATATRFAISSKHGNGLSLEVRAGKQKRFVYRFRLLGKQQTMVLGLYPAMGLAQARERHCVAVGQVKQGIDPRQVVAEAKQKNEQMLVLDELFEQWLSHKASVKRRDGVRSEISLRTVTDYRRIYQTHLQKVLGKYRVCDITMAVLHQHYQKLQKVSLEGLRKAMGIMNQVMEEAMRRQLIEMSPTLALKPKVYNATPNPPRERWLPISELRALWHALEEGVEGGGALTAGGRGIATTSVLSGSVANAIKIVILSAVRRGEVISMQWAHLDGDRWTIPETKNGRPHVVTLSPLAQEIISEQRMITSSTSPYVFESTTKLGHAITGDALMRALDRLQKRKLAELEPFSVHDLRRSVANCCGIELGAGPLEIEHMLNHQISDKLLRTYQAGALRNPEKLRSLFLRWGDIVKHQIAQYEVEKSSDVMGNVIQGTFGKR